MLSFIAGVVLMVVVFAVFMAIESAEANRRARR